MLGLGNFDTQSHLPESVSLDILRYIFNEIIAMKECHDELAGNNSNQSNNNNADVNGEVENGGEEDLVNNDVEDDNEGGDMDEDEEDDGEDEETPSGRNNEFTMNNIGWEAVEKAISNQISSMREENKKELQLPEEDSAKICRYNPKAHFRFVSDEANLSVDPLLDSLINCKLRSRPTNYSQENPVHSGTPFELRVYENSSFDLDGDMMAMCGDEYHNSLRSGENFVGYQRVPIPINLDSAKTMCALQDDNNSNEPWDTNVTKCLFNGKGKKEWFSTCMADKANNLVWAADGRTGKIHAFSTNASNDESVAKLSFASLENKASSQFGNDTFGLAKCNGTIIGSCATGRLSAWNISSALEDSSKTIEPKHMVVDQLNNFLCGDIQHVSGSNVIVAPLRFDFNESDHSTTLRLYDVNAESTIGLFAGTLGEVSIGKQYCVETHNSIFAMSNNVGVVFDTRTYQPTIALHHEKRSGEQILGVPTTSTPVAFTYGSEEDIKCWDLRNPGSHVYTMATGNTIIDHLLWHEDTSSLLASTHSKHLIQHGRVSGYMYGETLTMDDEEEVYHDSYWPKRAFHSPSFFPSRWHCDCQNSPVLLQYPFKNGRSMHKQPGRLKSCET